MNINPKLLWAMFALFTITQSVCAFAQTDWVRLGASKLISINPLLSNRLVCLSDKGDVLISESKKTKWEQRHIPTAGHLQGMDFADSLRGIIVGDSGVIFSTKDGGDTWSLNPFISKEKLTAIEFVNATTLLVTSASGNIYKSVDGGDSWIVSLHAEGENFNKIARIGSAASSLIAITDGGKIWRSSNSGATWDSVFNQPSTKFYSCSSYKEAVVITGNKGIVLISKDTGLTWVSSFSDNTIDLYSSLFLADSTIVTMGSKGYAVRSSDAGVSWQKYRINDTALATTFYSLARQGNTDFAVGDNSAIFTSTDSGSSWSSISHMPFPYSGTPFSALSESYHFTDSIWYFFTGKGGIYKTTDAGTTWRVSFCLQSYTDITGMRMYDQKKGFITGAIDGIYEITSDGGQTWGLIPPENHHFGRHSLKDLQFVTDSIGFILSDSILWKTSDMGEHWDSIRTPLAYPWRLSFVDSNIGFMCGSVALPKKNFGGQGGIYRTTDGGSNTSLVFSKDSVAFYGIKMVDEEIGYACGDKGTIVKTTDGGNTWIELSSGITQRLMDIAFINDTVGVAVGDGYRVVTTYDGGAHWSVEDFSKDFPGQPSLFGFSGVSLVDSNRVCIVGAEKAIYMKKLLPQNSTSVIASNVPFNPFLEIVIFPTPAIEKLTVSLRGLFSIPNEYVTLSLYDVMGRKVKTLFEGMLPEYTVKHVDMNFRVNDIPSGVYYVHLESSSSACLTKIIISK